jgi:hypothetical protein
MTTKVRASTRQRVEIDLTGVSYFPAEPLVIQEASGLERVRATDVETETAPSYLVDGAPRRSDDSMFFGGLGLAAVMDVGAHPLRARVRRMNASTVVAVSLVLAVGALMFAFALTLKP